MKILKLLKYYLKSKEKTHYYWEYYNRFRFVTDQIKALGLKDYNILDVGGATGGNLLKRFGLSNVTTLDVLESADIVSSADEIPVEDGSFEIVTCIDTLEHIPGEKRLKVVKELIRVARKAVFLIAPLWSEENNKAEKLVLEYVDNAFLAEHQKYGLVDFEQIETFLKTKKQDHVVAGYEKILLDDLLNWVAMMIRPVLDESVIYEKAYFLENQFHPRRMAISITL